ncbi:MAG: WD40 repeat domain-containing protein, partial [Planctomycetota bacterium]
IVQPRCKLTPLWDTRGCDDNLVTHEKCKDYPSLKQRTQNFIKGMKSKNARRRKIAFAKFRQTIPLVHRYVRMHTKKYIKQFSFPDALTIYSNINYAKVDEAKVICEYGDKFVWYALIDREEDRGLIIVGDEKGPKDSFYVWWGLGYSEFKVKDYSCEIVEGILNGYAIEIEGKSFEKYYSKVFTNGMIFRDFRLFRNNSRTRYVLVRRDQRREARGVMIVPGVMVEQEGLQLSIIVTDSQGIKEYEVPSGQIVFSRDDKRMGFSAKKDSKYVAVIDNRESKEYDKVWMVSFSPDGKRAGFLAKKGNKYVVVVDGKESDEYDRIAKLTFSPDSKRTGFVAKKGNKYVAVVDGKESNKYDWIERFTFSPDSKRTGFVAKKGDKEIVVVDGKESKEYDKVWIVGFSYDGKRVGAVGRKGTKFVVVIDDNESKEYDWIIWGPVFSPDSKRVGFSAKKGNKVVVIIDGQESNEYDSIFRSFFFSPDSKRTGFSAQKMGKYVGVIDGKESNEYHWISDIVFSSDSKRTGFVARKGMEYVAVIDGQESKGYDRVRGFSFSRDGKRVSFVAKKDEKYVAVIDGYESDEYDSIVGFIVKFVYGSKYAVFIGTKEVSQKDKVESKFYVVVNNKEIMSFKNITTFVEVKKGFRFLAHIANKIYLVACK